MAQSANRSSRDELIETHLGLVTQVALSHLRATNLPMSMLQDLQSYGHEGLVKAADGFDCDRPAASTGRPVQFKTYAEWKIRGAIKNGVKTWRKARALHQAQETHDNEHAELGAEAVDSFIARMSQTVLTITHHRLALDAGVVTDSEEDSPEDLTIKREQVEHLTELLQEMDPHRREVLLMSYVEGLGPTEIGQKLGMEKSSVTHLRNRTLKTLRRQFDAADGESEDEGA